MHLFLDYSDGLAFVTAVDSSMDTLPAQMIADAPPPLTWANVSATISLEESVQKAGLFLYSCLDIPT